MWRWACALALLCAAFARSSALKRAEMSAAPFILSSRYGRSPPRIIEPRNDRFFMGSRYGKRSEPSLEASHRTLQTLPDVTLRDIMLLCELKTFAPLCPHLQISPKVIYKRSDAGPDSSSFQEITKLFSSRISQNSKTSVYYESILLLRTDDMWIRGNSRLMLLCFVCIVQRKEPIKRSSCED